MRAINAVGANRRKRSSSYDVRYGVQIGALGVSYKKRAGALGVLCHVLYRKYIEKPGRCSIIIPAYAIKRRKFAIASIFSIWIIVHREPGSYHIHACWHDVKYNWRTHEIVGVRCRGGLSCCFLSASTECESSTISACSDIISVRNHAASAISCWESWNSC